jgi:agmatine deiminase
MTLFFSELLRENPELSAFWHEFEQILTRHTVDFRLLPNTKDIWCRDFMPVQVGGNEFVQFALSPDYYQPKDRHRITDPATICRQLGITPVTLEHEGTPVCLEGGNVVRTSRKAILCDKVLKDNKISGSILTAKLREALKVDELVIIPREPYDYTGHADGMIRFIDDHCVAVNDYAQAGSKKRFVEKLHRVLQDAGLEIILVPYNPSESIAYDQPATGCYINYLDVSGMIFLPTFNDRANDEKAIKRFGEIFGPENLVPVPCMPVARLGGVLNCLSWEIQ